MTMPGKGCKKRKPLRTELAYAAGIVDGEGYICVNSYCPRKNGNGMKQYNLRVGVINTNMQLLLWLKERFGGYIRSHGKCRSPKHKQAYAWDKDARKAEEFLRKIYPYLVIKRARADVAFKFRQTFDSSNYLYCKNGRLGGKDILPEVLSERMRLRSELKELNKRGPRT